MDQMQHAVSATYLEQFAHLEGTQLMLSTIDKRQFALMDKLKRRFTSPKSIVSLTTSLNAFDITGLDPSLIKFLEQKFGELESQYVKRVKGIEETKFSDSDHQYFADFISSLLIRSEPFRNMLSFMLIQPSARESLERMAQHHDRETIDEFVGRIMGLLPEHRLNPVSAIAFEFLQIKLLEMKCIFLKDYDGRGWITSDNPVVIKHGISRRAVLTKEADVYFPLSRSICLYMYNERAEFALNPLRNLPPKTFFESNEWVHWMVQEMIADNSMNHIYLPRKVKFSESFNADSN